MFRANLSVHEVRGVEFLRLYVHLHSVYVHYVTLIHRRVPTLHFIISFSYVVFRRRTKFIEIRLFAGKLQLSVLAVRVPSFATVISACCFLIYRTDR